MPWRALKLYSRLSVRLYRQAGLGADLENQQRVALSSMPPETAVGLCVLVAQFSHRIFTTNDAQRQRRGGAHRPQY